MAGQQCGDRTLVELKSHVETPIVNGSASAEFLVLQGKAIAEPIARRGPFVMNTWDEIRQAYADYQRTQFGGWPWKSIEPVHGMEPQRFARRGKDVEYPT